MGLTGLTQYEVWTSERIAAPVSAQATCFAVATLGEASVAGSLVALLALTCAVASYAP